MTEAEVAEKSKPWQWPGEWMKDEKFWKDVASRTLSGVLAVGIIYLYGLAVGYFKTPVIVGTTLLAIGAGGFAIVLILLGIVVHRVGFKNVTGHEKFLRTFEVFLMVSGAILLIGTIFLTSSGQLDDLRPFLEDFLNF